LSRLIIWAHILFLFLSEFGGIIVVLPHCPGDFIRSRPGRWWNTLFFKEVVDLSRLKFRAHIFAV
jgi:hypothetical protein